MDSMYSVLKSLVPQNEWPSYVTSLIAETQKKKSISSAPLHLYTGENVVGVYGLYTKGSIYLRN